MIVDACRVPTWWAPDFCSDEQILLVAEQHPAMPPIHGVVIRRHPLACQCGGDLYWVRTVAGEAGFCANALRRAN